jgi:hypothetical protein
MTEKFILTENHLKLAKRMYVGWFKCHWGAPTIDPVRPYGNSDVDRDVLKIIGEEPTEIDEDDELAYSEKQRNFAIRLHDEMKIALQIILLNVGKENITGKYEKIIDFDVTSWRKVK